MLVDSARMTVVAGRGGDGCVSFRREKYVPRGGPNGGDGGRGGDVVLSVNAQLNTLLHIHHRTIVRAERGRHGQGSNKTGASGSDAMVEVPAGTQVTDADSGELLADLVDPGQKVIVAAGGAGGRGNARFATSTQRAPRRAEEGRPGQQRNLHLTLKLLADVGLVGLPNAGKSTLLSRLSAARPKIADYPFTTVEPHLGVVRAPADEHTTCVMADIPGLIEGAHAGAGLGIQFLQHVERCRLLLHLVELVDLPSLPARVETVAAELAAWDGEGRLASRPVVLVGTKLDVVPGEEHDAAGEALATLQRAHGVVAACAVSAVTGAGLDELLGAVFQLLAREA